jgi:cytochrome c oxidase assembly factor CtaG/putative copper export protein
MSAEVLVTLAAVVRDASMALVAGALLLVAAVLPQGPAARRAISVATAASVAWAIGAGTFLIASSAVVLNSPPTDPLFGPQTWQFATETALGRAQLYCVAAAIFTSVIVGLLRTPAHAVLALIPLAFAIGWQAQTGHAGGAANHHLAVTAMFLHLAGSAAWLGLLVVLALIHRSLGDEAADAMRRVSRMAIWAAWAIVVSGAVNAWLRLGSLADFFTSTYGRLLLAKLVLMSAAIVLATWHRRVNLPRLAAVDVRERFWRIVWVDIALLVAIVAIAGVLSRQGPPAPIEPVLDPSPAFLVTGYALPPAPSLGTWLGLWRIELVTLFAIVAAGVVYVRWYVRLRSRGDHWPARRVAWFIAGLVLAVWVTQGAPAMYGLVTFSGHMVEHMLLVMAVPLPLTLAAPVTLAMRALPVRADGSRGSREWLRIIVDSRVMRFLAHPVVAAANFALSMLLFYYSPMFEFALGNHAAHLWMIFHFVLVGYFFFNALVGTDPGPTRPSYPMRIVLLFATMAFHAFFGVALSSSQALLAPRWYGLMGRTWGPDALTDQQFGGSLAWGLGEIPIVLLAIVVLVQWSRDDARESKRKDRQADRDDDAELRRYNAMLGRRAADQDRNTPGGDTPSPPPER